MSSTRSTWPRYCHNDSYILADNRCPRYGEPLEPDDCRESRGHGPSHYCPGCGVAPKLESPEDG